MNKKRNTSDLEGRYHYFNSEKGVLRECTNWRGIALLSIPVKHMARMMLNRVRLAVDERLRQEQAGFRPGRPCCEQFFTRRQIIEKSLKPETLIIDIIYNFYDGNKCAVRHGGEVGSGFRSSQECG